MVSDAKFQHLREMLELRRLPLLNCEVQMKGQHKTGDSVLIRATIKRVDEGNILERIDPATGQDTGIFTGEAIIDVVIGGGLPFSISAREVINETAVERGKSISATTAENGRQTVDAGSNTVPLAASNEAGKLSSPATGSQVTAPADAEQIPDSPAGIGTSEVGKSVSSDSDTASLTPTATTVTPAAGAGSLDI